MNIEDLKCCGNCEYNVYSHDLCDKDNGKTLSFAGCPQWKWDKLNKSERFIELPQK